MLFSQRENLTKSIKDLQVKEIDLELRNRLWNLFSHYYWKNFKNSYDNSVRRSNFESLFFKYWDTFFKWTSDTMPYMFYEARDLIKTEYFELPWFRIFDFIEFTIKWSDYSHTHRFASSFTTACNKTLEEENSAYRLINDIFVEITSDTEIESIEEAIQNTSQFSGIQTHLSSAIEHLSNRKNPDYRNSIKESISAVEAICQILTRDKNATLGTALDVLQKNMNLHGAIKSGFSSLYGYSSNADGIRHALLEEPTLTYIDAKYMLVTCSAFINYIIGHAGRLGIKLEIPK